MILILARVFGVGLMTAESLVREVLYRKLRDRRAVARYVGLTGSPDESGKKRREQGLAKAGNGRIRRALIQLAWRLLRHQPESALVKWYRARTGDGRRDTRKVMIVALARKLLVAFWELVTNGTVPEGMRLHQAKVAG
jgi:transposase